MVLQQISMTQLHKKFIKQRTGTKLGLSVVCLCKALHVIMHRPTKTQRTIGNSRKIFLFTSHKLCSATHKPYTNFPCQAHDTETHGNAWIRKLFNEV